MGAPSISITASFNFKIIPVHFLSNLLQDILHPYFLFHSCHLKSAQIVYWNNKYQVLLVNQSLSSPKLY